ncbi:MAG TPA: nitroreductase family protein [Chloroflexota bacterium]|jgi:coenzyme F420-0:L-glutamate ligase/coenzyme F420-1:gamma-L-glutamate ligase|nr:nitroreductase family protein [Chloroflexota bacterium]
MTDEALLAAFERVLHGRRTVRYYRPVPVPADVLAACLAAAAHAPAPHHRPPWRLVVLTRPAAKTQLAGAMGAAWARDLRADGVAEERIAALLAGSHARIAGAPAVVVLCTDDRALDRYPDARRQAAEQQMAAQSAGAALQNVMLAAHARGLATCWMCAPLFCPEVVAATLGLAPALRPQALLTLGYPAQPPPPRPRLAPDQLIVRWD